jgi:uncharacterized protein YggT (Ycf19 family)
MQNQLPADPYKKSMGEVVVYIVRIFSLIAITLLSMRFFLLLFSASSSSSFTRWVYRSSDIVLRPFRGIFDTNVDPETGSVLDISVLFAIVIYMLLAYWMGNLVQAWERKRLTDYKRTKLLLAEQRREEEMAKARAAKATSNKTAQNQKQTQTR